MIWAGADPSKVLSELPCVGLSGDRYCAPMRVSEKWMPYQMSCMVIDPSGRGQDETAYAVGKLLNSQIFVLEAGGLAGVGYDEEALSRLVSIARRNKVNHVLIESNFGDGMFKALIEPYFAREYPVTIEEIRHNIQKEKRIIDTLEPVMNQHRLIVDRGVVEKDFESVKANMRTLHRDPSDGLKYQLFYQMSHITADRGSLGHDDRLDALAMLVAYFVRAMNQDVDRQVEMRKDRELREELKVFQSLGSLTSQWFGEAVVFGKEEEGRSRPSWQRSRGSQVRR